MPVERTAGGTSLIDVLDRVLDKGIVIDAWVRVSVVGIDLVTVEARVVVASIETFMRYSDFVVQRPATETTIKQVPSQRLQVQLADGVPSTPPTASVPDGRPPVARRARERGGRARRSARRGRGRRDVRRRLEGGLRHRERRRLVLACARVELGGL